MLSARGAMHLVRRLDTLITAAVLPIVLLLLFAYLFGGAVQAALPQGEHYLNYVLPGILLSSIGYVATTTATGVCDDISKGLADRLRSMPIVRCAFMAGHVFASLIRNLVACMCVSLVALAIGYRSPASLSAWLLATFVLVAFALAMTSVAVVIGLLAPGPDAASAYGMPLMFLSYFSGALVPIETMPRALQVFCTHQPVNAVWRSLSALTLGGSEYGLGATFAWCIGISIVCLTAGGMLFARKGR